MEKKLISVIVPFSNEKYLERCVKSILNQTYNRLEIFLIANGVGMKDKDIYSLYAQNDNRVKVIYVPEASASKARNTGIDNAKGEYILFVDSDDWLELSAVEEIERKISDPKELIAFNYIFCKNNDVKKQRENNEPDKIIIKTNDWLELYTSKILSVLKYNCWNKLYSKEIIQKNKICFNEEIKIGEDYLFNLSYIKVIDKVRYINKKLYNYFYNDDGISRKYSIEILESHKKIIEKIESEYENSEIIIDFFAVNTIQWAMRLAVKNAGEEGYKIVKELMENKFFKSRISGKGLKYMNLYRRIFYYIYRTENVRLVYIFIRMCSFLKKQ